jgi:TPP-dependent pyruvate/acetoin dehydrogenase alpha subunit
MADNEVIRQSIFNRYFEKEVATALDEGFVKSPIYLSLGSEHIPPAIISGLKDRGVNIGEFYLLAQHRCHSYFLSMGGDPYLLAMELCGQETGCNNGYGGSASISLKNKKMMGHSGLLGDQVPIGVGLAAASNMPTVIVMGDAAAEEDYVLGAMGHAVTKKAPVIFVVEDNNLSILTEKKVRRSWDIVAVAKAMGMNALDIDDYPGTIRQVIPNMDALFHKPLLININCERQRWHAGSGIDGKPTKRSLDSYIDQQHYAESDYQETITEVIDLWKRVKSDISRNN